MKISDVTELLQERGDCLQAKAELDKVLEKVQGEDIATLSMRSNAFCLAGAWKARFESLLRDMSADLGLRIAVIEERIDEWE